MPGGDDSTMRSWEAIADDWVIHADSSDYQNVFLVPRMLQMLGDVSGGGSSILGAGKGGTRANWPAAALSLSRRSPTEWS